VSVPEALAPDAGPGHAAPGARRQTRPLWMAVGGAGAAQVVALVAGLVTLTITARWLGPEGRGVIAASLGWSTLFASLGGLSLGPVAQHRATVRRDADWIAGLLEHLVGMAAAVGVASWVLIAVLYAATQGAAFGRLPTAALAVAALGVPFAVWEQYGAALLAASGDVPAYSRAVITGRSVGLAALIVAWVARAPIAAVVATTVLAQSVIGVLVFRALVRDRVLRWPDGTDELRGLVADGVRLHLNYVGGYLIGNAGVLVVNHFHGAGPTGHYQVAVQLASTPGVLAQAAAMVMSGQVARLGPDAAWPYQRRLLLQVLALLAVGSVLAALIASWVVPMIFGVTFTASVPLLRWFLLPALAGSVVTMLTPQWVGRGLFLTLSMLSLVTGVLVLGLNLALVPRLGAMGAVWASLVVYLLALAGQAVLLRRELRHD
jgi:O-antigen/teichoic acid export membrane protein